MPQQIGPQTIQAQIPQQQIQHQMQQTQQIPQQPPIQRMVPPQMLMRPQQAQQMAQAAPGQMKQQFRLVHRDMNTMHQNRMDIPQGNEITN